VLAVCCCLKPNRLLTSIPSGCATSTLDGPATAPETLSIGELQMLRSQSSRRDIIGKIRTSCPAILVPKIEEISRLFEASTSLHGGSVLDEPPYWLLPPERGYLPGGGWRLSICAIFQATVAGFRAYTYLSWFCAFIYHALTA